MKYCILLLCLLCACNVAKSRKQTKIHEPNESTNAYTVKKIDSIPKAYVIYVERNDSIFKLVSLKDMVVKCRVLNVGCRYNFSLASWLKTDTPSLIRVDGLHVYGTSVGFRNEEIVQDIFYAKNLKGLCIIE